MSCYPQCEATPGCPLSCLLAPFPPGMDYLLTGNQLARRARACGLQPVQSQRDMGTKELHARTGGHPLELALSTMSSVLPGQGMRSGDGACCCQSSLPDGGSFGGRAGCISLFLSWNWSIYSFLMLL